MTSNEVEPFTPNAVTLSTILLSSMVILMGAAVVAPAIEPIAQYFGVTDSFTKSLVVSLPSLSCAITGFAMGYLADRLGKVKVFFGALVIFTVTGAAGFFAPTYEVLLILRFLLGIGITGISLTTTALIGEYYSGMNRVKVIGYQSAAIGVGTLILETLGGAMADIGWAYPFLVYLIGLPILVMGFVSIRDPSRIVRSNEQAGTTPELEIPDKGRRILICYLVVFMEMFLMFSVPMNFSAYVSELGVNYTMCGLLMGTMGVSQGVFSILYSRRASKPSEFSAYAIAFLLMAVSLFLLYIPVIYVTFVSMVFMGCSLGLLMPTVISQLSLYSTAKTSGKVMGGYSVALNLSNFVSTVVFAIILGIFGSFFTTYAFAGALGVVMCILSLVLRACLGAPSVEDDVSGSIEVPLMYSSIMVATDGSEGGMYAIRNAVAVARRNSAHLTVLYVSDPEDSSIIGNIATVDDLQVVGGEIAHAAFDRAREMAADMGVVMSTQVLSGRPADVIVSESVRYDLIVCGSLGRTNTERVLMGSVADSVVRKARCPVLVCRNRSS